MSLVILKNSNIKIYKENRPWGDFQKFVENKKTTVKIITVLAGKRLSLQYHIKRDEFWKVIKGRCLVTIGEKTFPASQGSEFYIPRGTSHRIEAVDNAEVLEISTGHFNEKDIVRIQDDHGR